MTAVRFNTPQPSYEPDSFPFSSPLELSRALRELPYRSHLPETLPSLLDGLTRLNRTPMDVNKRLPFNRGYLFAIHQVLQALQKDHWVEKSFVQVNTLNHHQLIDLFDEIALSNLILLNELQEQPYRTRERDETTFNSIYYLSLSIICRFCCYEAQQADIWEQLYQLFNYAESSNKLNQKHALPAQPEKQQTIHGLFVQLQLTVLTDPYHLEPGSIWQLFQLAGHYADKGYMFPVIRKFISENSFLIDLSSQQKATPINDELPASSPSCRILAIDDLIISVQQELSRISMKSCSQNNLTHEQDLFHIQLLRYALSCWLKERSRQHERKEKQKPINLVWTIRDIHTLLSTDRKDQQSLNHQTAATMENISEPGYCIRLQSPKKPRLQNGQLIAIVDESEAEPRIGIVRWYRLLDRQQALFGVECFSGTVTPVTLNNDHQLSSLPVKALLVSGPWENAVSLLVEKNETPDEKTIHWSHQEATLEDSRLIEHTQQVDQYRIRLQP